MNNNKKNDTKKLKVAWICHFSNAKIREKLPLSKLTFLNTLRLLFGKNKKDYYTDFAPWVNNLIKEFEKFSDIELHVIAPFRGLKLFDYEFEMNGVFYHFYKCDLPIIHLSLSSKFYSWIKPKLIQNRYLVKKIIKKIKPDLINLIGTENPYYSITSLDIKKIPVYVSAQTVYTNPERKKYENNIDPLIWDIELKIHRKEKYYGCIGRMHRDLIVNNNPEAIIFKMFFPIEKPKEVKQLPKIYDFVFFAAGITRKKGIEDAIDALSLVKKEKPKVTLNVVGKCQSDYKSFLQEKIIDLKLQDNIIFTDYFPIHTHMHQHIVQSRFSLLPVKLDIIPGTILESIFLNIPVITYKTTGTPFLNKDGESVLLSNIGDINNLAQNMLKLLNNPSLGERLRKSAKAYVDKEFDNTTSAKRLVLNYRSVINHYHYDIPIPKEQLFNIDEFPKN